MDRDAFAHLYLHAHALADLAFLRALAGLSQAPAPTLSPEVRAERAAEAERLLHLGEAEFDWGALDGVQGFDDAGAATGAVSSPVAAEAEPLPGLGFGDALAGDDDVDLDAPGLPDPDRYLARVRRAAPAMGTRVDALWARADGPALAALADALPGTRAPLTQPLDGASFGDWLRRYEAGEAPLLDLVDRVRGMEPTV